MNQENILPSDAHGLACLWEATAPALGTYASLSGPVDADIVVVGAGIAGLSAALAAAQHGRPAIVLEAREPGFGASGRSGGQVIAGLRHDPAALVSAYGETLGLRAHAFGASAAEVTFELIRHCNIDCDAEQSGWIQAADTPRALQEAKTRVELWRKNTAWVGSPPCMLDREEFEGRTGSRSYLGGWLDPRGGVVQPLSYVRGLARAVVAAGARIYARSPALAIEREGAGWRVRTPGGFVNARALLLATGALTDDVWPRLRRTILKPWSFQIATRPLSPALKQRILPSRQAVSDTRRVIRYFRVDRDHRLIVGGKGTNHAPRSSCDFAFQQTMLSRLYPELAGEPIEFRWGGEVAVSMDRLPRIYSLGPGSLATMGCNGKGVAWNTALGPALAEALIENTTRALPIPATPLAPIPFHTMRGLYVRGGSAWLRLLDKLDAPMLKRT